MQSSSRNPTRDAMARLAQLMARRSMNGSGSRLCHKKRKRGAGNPAYGILSLFGAGGQNGGARGGDRNIVDGPPSEEENQDGTQILGKMFSENAKDMASGNIAGVAARIPGYINNAIEDLTNHKFYKRLTTEKVVEDYKSGKLKELINSGKMKVPKILDDYTSGRMGQQIKAGTYKFGGAVRHYGLLLPEKSAKPAQKMIGGQSPEWLQKVQDDAAKVIQDDRDGKDPRTWSPNTGIDRSRYPDPNIGIDRSRYPKYTTQPVNHLMDVEPKSTAIGSGPYRPKVVHVDSPQSPEEEELAKQFKKMKRAEWEQGAGLTTGWTGKGARGPNAWLQHVQDVRQSHPGLSYKEALLLAKESYKK
jgi:hypothetical protein